MVALRAVSARRSAVAGWVDGRRFRRRAIEEHHARGRKPNQYGDVILPFTMLCRPDCIFEPAKDQVGANSATIR